METQSNENENWQKWFEGIWEDREEKFYPSIFGPLDKGMFPLQEAAFKSIGVPLPDPRFLFHGVLVSPPNDFRKTFLYVTTGMSNALGADPKNIVLEEYSGLGFEFILETPERSDWAVAVLHWLMAVQLAVATGNLQGELIAHNDRVPVGGPIDGKKSELNTLLITEPLPPSKYPGRFATAAGKVDLLVCIGITQREREFAASQGSPGLVDLLVHREIFPVTDPNRPSAV
jgi:hypothetical protein